MKICDKKTYKMGCGMCAVAGRRQGAVDNIIVWANTDAMTYPVLSA
jgi:hypothetical protein